MMELGNMMFGNSRGNYRLEREVGYEEQLERLFDAYTPNRTWQDGYSPEFENETFCVFPYYWGEECVCGADEEADKWAEEHPHKPDCYQSVLHARMREFKTRIGYVDIGFLDMFVVDKEEPEPGVTLMSFEPRRDPKMEDYHSKREQLKAFEEKLYDELCTRFKVDRERGVAVHCTCGRDDAFDEWADAHDHDPECPIVKPNFLYKPTGLGVQWYKYPLRDSYISEEVSVAEFAKVIDACIASL